MNRLGALALVVGLALVTSSCSWVLDLGFTVEADAGNARDTGPVGGDAGDGEGDACVATLRPVDVLVVVDDSNSMLEEQQALTVAFPELVRQLVTGDLEPDGERDFPPAQDLHVGVVTTDMGSGGNEIPGCADPDFGDDGRLRSEPSPSGPSVCEESYPTFLEFEAGGALSRFRESFTCVAMAGVDGCGFEQPLEAALKALTPSTVETRFHAGTAGHGDGANAGFLRDESVLVVLLVTDEDDCSAVDPDLFDLLDPDGPYAGTHPNLRCPEHPEALHPISRYADGLRALRPDAPERLVFGAITGIPPSGEGGDYEGLLTRDDMQLSIQEGDTLAPACSSANGEAPPARRVVQTAMELDLLGSPTAVRSICREDYTGAMSDLVSLVAPELEPRCR
jgi:hypothetical protein